MTYDAVARAIAETTRLATGISISPHLSRTSIASSAAVHGRANPQPRQRTASSQTLVSRNNLQSGVKHKRGRELESRDREYVKN
jgi:hypothetical protein